MRLGRPPLRPRDGLSLNSTHLLSLLVAASGNGDDGDVETGEWEEEQKKNKRRTTRVIESRCGTRGNQEAGVDGMNELYWPDRSITVLQRRLGQTFFIEHRLFSQN